MQKIEILYLDYRICLDSVSQPLNLIYGWKRLSSTAERPFSETNPILDITTGQKLIHAEALQDIIQMYLLCWRKGETGILDLIKPHLDDISHSLAPLETLCMQGFAGGGGSQFTPGFSDFRGGYPAMSEPEAPQPLQAASPA